MLCRAYPGTAFDWWLQQAEHDDRLIATAIDILEAESGDSDDGDEDG